MLSVQNYNYQPKVSFKQNPQKQENKPNSFTTHAGLKTGIAVSVLGAGYKLAVTSVANGLLNQGRTLLTEFLNAAGDTIPKEMKTGIEAISNSASKNYWTIPVTFAIYTGCGALIDKYINDKRANFAEATKNKDIKEIAKNERKARFTEKGNSYYESNIGKKYGTLLGIVALPILKAINGAIKGNHSFSLFGLAIYVAGGALGGLTLGAITDHYANKGAKKFADK